MISKKTYEEFKKQALELYEKAHIILTEEEKERIEVSDFGLNDMKNVGLQLVVYVNTERVCAKEMVVLPGKHVQNIFTSMVLIKMVIIMMEKKKHLECDMAHVIYMSVAKEKKKI